MKIPLILWLATLQDPAPPLPAPRAVRLAAAQPRARLIDWKLGPAEALDRVERNLDALEELVHRAGRRRCDALALPEDTLGLGKWEAAHRGREGEVLRTAVPRLLERLGQAAAQHRMYLICCTDTVDPDGALRNTAFFLGRDGKEIGRYHKVNMPIHELHKKRGDGFPVFRTPDLGGIGMLICYDMVFPEAARCLALGGAEVIFHLTLGGAAIGSPEISRAAFRTRAVENFVYIVVSERGSGSMILSPQGEILAEAKEPDEILQADVDPFGGREGGDAFNRQRDMRARLFRERHPPAFGILVAPRPPALERIPETTTVEDAVRISCGALTVGEERFQEADRLLREGKTLEAAGAFDRLIEDYPGTWIERVSRQRRASLGSRP